MARAIEEDPARARPAPPARTARPTEPSSSRRADIQGLRAVAVGLVVAFHAGLPVPGGFIGVDMFFVISGFVIGAMLLRQLETTGRVAFGEFYARRMRRLLPALAVALVVVAVASALFLSPFGRQQATARTGIAASLFAANLQLAAVGGGGYFEPAAETNALLHTWSLSVEEQFYLVFPAFLVGAWALARRLVPPSRRRLAAGTVVGTATLASFAVSCWGSLDPANHLARVSRFAFYSPVTRAWEFGAGVLLALAAPALVRLPRSLATPLALAGAVAITVGAVHFDDATPFPGLAALAPVLGTAALLVAGTAAAHPIGRALSVRPMTWVGDISYGWYLWHWPLIVFTAALWPGSTWLLVLAAAVSLVPTWVSYRAVENRFRFDPRLVGRRVVPLLVICVGVPLLAFGGLLLVNRVELRSAPVRAFSEATVAPDYGPPGCDSSSLGVTTPCLWPVDDPRGTVVVIGDSNAGMFGASVARAAGGLGYETVVVSRGGCPFADVVRESQPKSGFDGEACHRFVLDSLDRLVAEPPALVVLSNSASQLMGTQAGSALTDPTTGQEATSAHDKPAVWERGVTGVLDRLDAAAIPTVLVRTIPNFGPEGGWWEAVTCPAVRIYTETCGRRTARSSVDTDQAVAAAAEGRAAAGLAHVRQLDLTSDICTAEWCATDRDGRWLYRDGTHLNLTGTLGVSDRFTDVLRSVLGGSGAASPDPDGQSP